MKLTFLLLGLLTLAISLPVNAGSVVLTTVNGRAFTSKSGITLPAGRAVRVGSFALTTEQLRNTRDYKLLKSKFKPLAEGIVGAGLATQSAGIGTCLCTNDYPESGETFGSIQNFSPDYIAPGTQLYAWVFDAVNPDNSTQWGIFTAPTWVAPQPLGTTALATSASMEAVQGSITAGEAKLGIVPASFANWTWQKLGLNANAPAAGDSDNDGLSNLAEYAWQLNPKGPSQAATVLATTPAGGASFSFQAPKALPDVTVSAECSTDLVNWTPAPATVTASTDEFDTLTCTAPPGARCFWRVVFNSTAP